MANDDRNRLSSPIRNLSQFRNPIFAKPSIPRSDRSKSQREYIDSLLPKVTNLRNLNSIDVLLSHLETVLSKGCVYEGELLSDCIQLSPIIYRILFTLSVESVSSHVIGESTLDGILSSLHSSNSLASKTNLEYQQSYKPALHVRSLRLLKNLHQLSKRTKDGSGYIQLKLLLQEFLVVRESKRGLRLGSRVNYDIIHHFKAISSQIDSDQEDNKTDEDKHSEVDVISDSEDDVNGNLLGSSSINSQSNMTRDVHNFKFSRLSPKKRLASSPSIDQNEVENDPVSLFNDMPHLDSIREPSPKRQKSTPETDGELGESVHMQIFDQDSLTWVLNPNNIESHYNFWKLLQWCFHGCLISDSIFRNYNGLLSWIIDLLITNFLIEIRSETNLKQYLIQEHTNDPLIAFQASRKRVQRAVRLSVREMATSTRGVLFTNLLHQLSPSKYDWYDRLIEFTFQSLGNPGKNVPQPCYQRENSVLSNNKKLMIEVSIQKNLLESMNLRFKILILAYYRSLFLDCENEATESEGRWNLLKQITSKLQDSELLFELFEQFYSHATLVVDIPSSIQYEFLFELTILLLNKYCGNAVLSKYISKNIQENQTQQSIIPSFQIILEMIVEENIYSGIAGDIKESGWEGSSSDWFKLNFLLGWLLEVSLTISQRTQQLQTSEIDILCKKAKVADEIRFSCIAEEYIQISKSVFTSFSSIVESSIYSYI
ncbi:hypothetical protein CAAN1_34S00430 [[Candida] anglica]|uniref:Uncharacterized protein n=1 Tax=[Candida] anglica TaxID=148631 RepID=A0ABP0E9V4_9ASCO